jgi:L-ascorbate metabolism protein UlaG (beta-lactamase superfamily)
VSVTKTSESSAAWYRHVRHWIARKATKDLRFVTQAIADTFRTPANVPDVTATIQECDPSALTVNWFGHSTALIDFFGFRVLTDPVLGNRVGASIGPFVFGPKRYVKAPVAVKGLPALDLVLVSHAHMDHLDLGTLTRLERIRNVVSARRTTDLYPAHLIPRVSETEWWQEYAYASECGPIELIPFPVKHPGGRWRYDTDRKCNAYLLRRKGLTVAFLGDTAFDYAFAEVRRRLGAVDVAIVPISAYDPYRWNHTTPEEAVEIAELLGAKVVVPIHHETFKLGNEPLDEPRWRFLKAATARGLAAVDVPVGRPYVLSRL